MYELGPTVLIFVGKFTLFTLALNNQVICAKDGLQKLESSGTLSPQEEVKSHRNIECF